MVSWYGKTFKGQNGELMSNDTVVIWLAIVRGYEITNAHGCQVVDRKTVAQNLK